jgi:hypothetical protein
MKEIYILGENRDLIKYPKYYRDIVFEDYYYFIRRIGKIKGLELNKSRYSINDLLVWVEKCINTFKYFQKNRDKIKDKIIKELKSIPFTSENIMKIYKNNIDFFNKEHYRGTDLSDEITEEHRNAETFLEIFYLYFDSYFIGEINYEEKINFDKIKKQFNKVIKKEFLDELISIQTILKNSLKNKLVLDKNEEFNFGYGNTTFIGEYL